MKRREFYTKRAGTEMKIGLVDVDAETRVIKHGTKPIPNIALGKIARYHRNQGDEVEWASVFTHYDLLYMSKVFNFTPDDKYVYQADRIIKGGTGYDIDSRLPYAIDHLQPDYSLFDSTYYNIPKNRAYGFLTRGCPNKCHWCVVPRKEGPIKPYMDIEEIAIEGRNHIILMDNNILAAGDYCLDQFQKIIDLGLYVDFNQALDARILTDEQAQLMAKMKWINRFIRFGCDTKPQIEHCLRAMKLVDGYGYTGNYMLYTMLHGTFKECYQRLHIFWEMNQQTKRKISCQAQPYRDPMQTNNPPQWQKDLARWANNSYIYAVTDFKDFEPRKGFRCQTYLDEYL